MGHHTWPQTTSLFSFLFHSNCRKECESDKFALLNIIIFFLYLQIGCYLTLYSFSLVAKSPNVLLLVYVCIVYFSFLFLLQLTKNLHFHFKDKPVVRKKKKNFFPILKVSR